MDKQKIKEALDLLKAAIDDDDDQVTLKWTVSNRELDVLRFICRMDVSIPNVVRKSYPGVATDETRDVLRALAVTINNVSS